MVDLMVLFYYEFTMDRVDMIDIMVLKIIMSSHFLE
jgi:hypothetical protein